MLKKLLAGLTVVALSLGIVAVTAGPASATKPTVSASVLCTSPTTATVTWTVTDVWNVDGVVVSSTNNLVPAGTALPAKATQTYAQNVTWTGQQTRYDLKVTVNYPSRSYTGDDTGSITLKKSTFAPCVQVTAMAPSFTPAPCVGPGAVGQASYTIPAQTGVRYEVRINRGGWTPTGTGTYTVAADAFVEVQAFGTDGFELSGSKSWSQQFAAPDCTQEVVATAPTFAAAACTGPGTNGQASYTIPSTTGVRYDVRFSTSGSWTRGVAAATYSIAANGYVEVRAVALADYRLSGSKSWSQRFTTPDCVREVTPTKPVVTQAACVADSRADGAGYTIPMIDGVRFERSSNGASDWTTVLPGTYSVPDGSSIWIRAVALDGYRFADARVDYRWKLQFTDVDEKKCVVPTPPTPTYAVCTGPGTSSGASYLIPSDTGIQYQRWNGTTWVNVTSATVGVSAFPIEVRLRAIAAHGYTLVGGPYEWIFPFDSAGPCLEKVTPSAPEVTVAQCEPATTGKTQGGYLIPTTRNVVYTVSLNGAAAVSAATGVFVPTNVGDVVVITPFPASGYELSEHDEPWTIEFTEPGACLDDATPVPPVFTDAVCELATTGATTATYRVTAAANVGYAVSTDGGKTWTSVDPGTYDAEPGETIVVRATADPGYQLVDYDGPWEYTFAEPGDCLDPAPVDPVTSVDQACVVDPETGAGKFVSGSITIPDTLNVEYAIDGVPTLAGVYDRPPGSYEITATAMPGYQLAGYDGPYSLEITPALPCGELEVLPSVTPVVTATPATCIAAGTYTLGVEQEGLEDGVVWTVSGGLPNTIGVHRVQAAGTVTITATPADGYGFPGEEPQRSWTFEFAAASGDCLPTLALTGGAMAAGTLGVGGLLVVAGAMLFVLRRRGQVISG